MSEIVPIDSSVLRLIHTSFGKEGGLQPFAREIMLIEGHVAGTTHSKVGEWEEELREDDFLVLRRQPDNPHDPMAIMVLDEKGRRLGYVPRDRNEILARLLDAGKFLFGRIIAKKRLGEWLKIDLRIFLRD
jgi:hypothetical protein